MHAEVDYGETRFEIANPIENQTGLSGTGADGTQVALRFERVECIDNMSAEKFEARACSSRPPARSMRAAAGSDRTDHERNQVPFPRNPLIFGGTTPIALTETEWPTQLAHQKKQREEAARKKREEKHQRRQQKKEETPPPVT